MREKMKDVVLKAVTRAALNSARKEADSACMFIGYQPKMPVGVRKLKRKK